MKTNNGIKALLEILENPRAKKGYLDLKNYYDFIEKPYESSAIEHLIHKRFKSADDPLDNKKQ